MPTLDPFLTHDMTTLTTLTADTLLTDQAVQIVALYRDQGWWYDHTDAAEDLRLLERILAGSHCFLVAVEEGGSIAGMGRAISDGASDAYIQDVAVGGRWQHQGLGGRIVDAIVSRLVDDGIGWIGLIADNHTQHFYERLGFSPMRGAAPMLKLIP